MQAAYEKFCYSIQRIEDLHSVHTALSAKLTEAIDLSDILRAEIVLTISAFDFFLHEITRLGMIECFLGVRERSQGFQRFLIPMRSAVALDLNFFELEVREKHRFQSFQQPDKVADAIRNFSDVPLWANVANFLNQDASQVKLSLSLIVDRRNKIAHEADKSVVFPHDLWPIDKDTVLENINTIRKIGAAIFDVVTVP